jgi:hypothetical protein
MCDATMHTHTERAVLPDSQRPSKCEVGSKADANSWELMTAEDSCKNCSLLHAHPLRNSSSRAFSGVPVMRRGARR